MRVPNYTYTYTYIYIHMINCFLFVCFMYVCVQIHIYLYTYIDLSMSFFFTKRNNMLNVGFFHYNLEPIQRPPTRPKLRRCFRAATSGPRPAKRPRPGQIRKLPEEISGSGVLAKGDIDSTPLKGV